MVKRSTICSTGELICLAVSDLGFDLVGRLLEAAQDLGRVRLAIALDEQGVGHYSVNLAPASDTPLVEALAQARLLAAPKGLWQLPWGGRLVRRFGATLVPFYGARAALYARLSSGA